MKNKRTFLADYYGLPKILEITPPDKNSKAEFISHEKYLKMAPEIYAKEDKKRKENWKNYRSKVVDNQVE